MKYVLVRLAMNKYIVVKIDGNYNFLAATKVDPTIALTGKLEFGPSDYASAEHVFIQLTKAEK